MIRRTIGLVFGLVAAAVLVTVAVANRHAVTLVLDPFDPKDPVLSVQLPFYAYLFALLIVGVLVGGLTMWVSQRKFRRLAILKSHEALRWKGEAERLTRERDAKVANERRQQLAVVGR